MTITDYIRTGIMAFSLACAAKLPAEQYGERCIDIAAKHIEELCAQRDAQGTLLSLYDPHSIICFYKPGQEQSCGAIPRLALTPKLEHAFNSNTNLSSIVDQSMEQNGQ